MSGPAVRAVRVLLVEDSPEDADLIVDALGEAPRGGVGPAFDLVRVSSLADGLERLRSAEVGVVLLDLSLPDSHGIETFTRVHRAAPEVPIVVLSGLADERLAMRTVREGAQEYLVKGEVDGRLLVRSLRYAIERKRAEETHATLVREQAARQEAELGRGRMAFLAEAGALLASSLDYEVTLRRIAQLAVPALGDVCMVDLAGPECAIDRVAVVYRNADGVRSVPELEGRLPTQPDGPYGAWATVRTGEAELNPDLGGTTVEALLPLPADRASGAYPRFFAQIRPRARMVVPLTARGRTLGALTWLAIDPARVYGSDDLQLAVEIARRAALAVDNARLYREAQEAVRTRDDFLAAAAHDLKTPLTAIRGHAQMAQRQVARLDLPASDRLHVCLETIKTTADKMASMVNELVDVTHLSLGQPLELNLQAVDAVALVGQAVVQHQATSARHMVVVETELDGLVGTWDPGRLARVLDNLIQNAIKYSPEGGVVTISVGRATSEGAEWARIGVRDQGIGIPAKDLPHLFERFRRGTNVAGRIEGTGLGLAGVQQIVEQHGGRVEVDSREGYGSTFTVWLPVERIVAGSVA